MAKIKINKLPEGFKLVDGKIQKDQSMRDGGYVTGDQFDYGLVTTPQGYSSSNTNFNDDLDEDVRYSLSSVPRDKANIEAEGGETVLTDLTNDGRFGLYGIKGPRHSSGGVPMFLPEQSFIYSDTDKMKFTRNEMAMFGIESKKKKTPATISRKYDLNKYYGAMEDQFADDIQMRSAELMLNKNMNKLSELAYGQEVKKKFENGVPLAAHPYLIQQGIDPIEFTAQVEQISREQAQMNAIAALPPEQQEQIMMLQQMMAQADQRATQGMQEQQPMEEPMEEVVEDTVVMAQDGKEFMNKNSLFGSSIGINDKNFNFGAMGLGLSNPSIYPGQDFDRDGIPNDLDITPMGSNYDFRFQPEPASAPLQQLRSIREPEIATSEPEVEVNETEEREIVIPDNPLKKDHPKYEEWNEKLNTGNYTTTTVVRPDGKTEIKLIQSRKNYKPSQATSAGNQKGSGSTPIYNEDIAGQQRAIEERSDSGYQYLPGILSGGNRPLRQGAIYNNQIVNGKYDKNIKGIKSSGVYAYGSPEIRSEVAVKDFKNRWGDVIEQIDGFSFNNDANDPQWKKFQVLAEETRKKEHLEQFGSLDSYVPYFSKDGVSGSKYDGVEGLHTFNTPRLKKTDLDSDTVLIDAITEEQDQIDTVIPEEYMPAKPEFWRQDQNNLIALNLMNDDYFGPWSPDAERLKIDYTLDDWRARANANTAAANTMNAGIAGTIGGPGAVAAMSNVQGKTLDANMKAIAQTNTNNVGIMNRVAAMQPQLDMAINLENDKRNIKTYDDTNATLQNAQNFRNNKIMKNAQLQNAALTNRANTFNMNSMYDNYAVNPLTGGMINFTNPNALKKVGPGQDNQKALLDAYTDLRKNLPPDQKVDMDFLKLYMGMDNSNPRDITNAAAEAQRKGMPFSYPTGAKEGSEVSPKGKKIKKMAVPFYTGKMGS
tara:strand:+ start:5154 stop:7955 length:2802 start_codon:yes stop_codon:yes gene_type:complete